VDTNEVESVDNNEVESPGVTVEPNVEPSVVEHTVYVVVNVSSRRSAVWWCSLSLEIVRADKSSIWYLRSRAAAVGIHRNW